MMKKYCFVFFFCSLAPFALKAQTDAITKFFDKYLDDEKFTVVYITPKMFQMIGKLELSDPDARDVKEALKDLRGLRILTTDQNAKELYKEVAKGFSPADYELLMAVRDKGENVRFWTKEEGGIIKELLMLAGGDAHFTLMSFVGNIDLHKISKLANRVDVKGIEHLKEVDKK